MRRYGLRNDQRDRIKDMLPVRPGSVGVTAANNQLFVEAVLFRYPAGIPWRDLPERFGDWKNVHRRFSRWAKSGVWQRIFLDLATDADNEYAMIDSTIVRAHQHTAGAQSRCEPGNRVLTGRVEHQNPPPDRCSRQPCGLSPDRGEVHDLVGVDHLMPAMQASMLIADKAFDADKRMLEPLAAAGKAAVIPPKANRETPCDFDKHTYKTRHLIENFFARLKQYRAIATRYDSHVRS